MVNRSAEEIADVAEGNIKAKHLTKDSGMVLTYLYDGPLVEHLRENEQPEYIFSNQKKGFRITDETGESTPHHNGSEGKRYLLITDQRLLYVAGCKDGDESIAKAYDEILKINIVDNNNIEFYSTDKKIYKFAPVAQTKHTVEDAVGYVTKKISEIEQKDIDTEQDLKKEEGSKEDDSSELETILTMTGQNFTHNPIAGYIESGESIVTVLSDEEDMTTGSFYNSSDSHGIGINDKHNIKEPRESSPSIYVFTDNRILVVLPQKEQDELVSIEYNNIESIDDLHVATFGNRSRMSIHVMDGTTYHLWMSRNQKQKQEKIINHIRNILDRGREPDSIEQSGNPNNKSNPSSMTEPEFTTRGKTVKIEGNTRERTKCGKIKVYKNRIEIQQKGRLMSKGWFTIRFDDIVDVQKSSLGKMKFMTNRQDVTVSSIAGPDAVKISEQILEYKKYKKAKTEKKSKKMRKNINSTNSSADEIAKFAKLKEKGVITEEEFRKKKDELL